MRLTQFLAAATAFSLTAAPAVAVPANPAAKLSLASQAAAGGAQDEGAVAPTNRTYMLVGLGVVAVVLAALAMGDSDSTPASA